jgi:hypothetical protein
MFKNTRSKVLGFLAALAVTAGLGVVVAQTSNTGIYVGYNQVTGLNGQIGTPVAGGNLPVLSTTTTSCGTYATVNTSMVGGAGTWQVTANATSCTLLYTFPTAAPNGYNCVAQDETTPADTIRQSAHTTTSCTVTGTVVSGDKILIEVNGF